MWYVDNEGGEKPINKVKKLVFRLCNDSVFKEIFSKVPNALIVFISDILGIDYNSIKDNTKVELASEMSATKWHDKEYWI